jgi:hypothetical protein
MADKTFGCHDSATEPWKTKENGYIRVFDLAAEGVRSTYFVESVGFGITQAIAGDGSGRQSIAVRVYRVDGSLTSSDMVQIATVDVDVEDQSNSFVIAPIAATIPENTVFAVEIYVPNGLAKGNVLTLGFNDLGETGPTYIRAQECGRPEPTDIDDIHSFYESFHLIMLVDGTV